MPVVMRVNVNGVSDICCVFENIEIVIRVMGNMNCKNPVRESGIFPVE